MDEKKNKSVRWKIIFAAIFVILAIIAELYIVLKVTFYPYVFAIALAILAVVAMYFLVSGLLEYLEISNKRRDEQFEDTIKSQKASYILHKKYFESLEERMSLLEKAATLPKEEIVTAQKGIAKVIISRSRENTEATLSSHEQIIDMLGAFEKQLHETNAGLVEQLHENNAGLVERLNENNAGLVEKEKEINAESIQQMLNKQQEIIMNLKDMEERMNDAILQSQKAITEQIPVYATPIPSNMSVSSISESEPISEPVVQEEEIIPEEPVMQEEEIMPEEPVMAEEPVIMEEEMIPEEPVMMEEIIGEAVEEEKPPMPDLSDPNKKMSPDDIAALFANLGGGNQPAVEEPAMEEEAVMMEEIIAEEPVMLEEPMIMEEEIIAEEPVIMEEIIEKTVEEEKPPMPDLSDPNKKMSPDEIAALFANLA